MITENKGVVTGILIAATLWFFMFSPWTAPMINFWGAMTFSAVILTCVSRWLCPEMFKELRFGGKQIVLGFAIAFVLWWVFWIGDKMSQLIFNFARPQVDMIYSMGKGKIGRASCRERV